MSFRQLERLLQIDAALRSGQRQTYATLTQVVDACDRTVRNDLAFLRDRYHAPLQYDRRRGWHYTDPDWRLPTVSLSLGELFAVVLGARMLESYAGSAYRTELNSAIEQLSQRLPKKTQVNLQKLSGDRVLFRQGAEVNLDPHTWQALQTACHNCQRVRVRYYSAQSNVESEREIDPYILHVSRSNPYVTGFCHVRQAIRDFRVDRIRAIAVLEQRFVVDPSFDADAYLAEAFQYERGGKPTPVTIWFDARTAPYIRERNWHESQRIEEQPDGSLVLHFMTRGLGEVKRFTIQHG